MIESMDDKFEDLVKRTLGGIRVEEYTIYTKGRVAGRFPEEEILDIYLKKDSLETALLKTRLYKGWGTDYRPWIEIFSINHNPVLGEESLGYFDSAVEEKILELCSEILPPGGKLYVEYSLDKETASMLIKGAPAVATRLGYKLYHLGFTWFKDWYFPEGGKEGGEKLEGEKPLDGAAKNRHMKNIKKELSAFLFGKNSDLSGKDSYDTKALERGKEILDHIKKRS